MDRADELGGEPVYVHCVDEDFGAFFIKFSRIPLWRQAAGQRAHYAQARAARAGIGFTALDNGFAACDDVAGLQAVCDSLTEDKIEALARKWLAILPNPYSPADQAAGYRYDISVLQAEFSLTQVLVCRWNTRGVDYARGDLASGRSRPVGRPRRFRPARQVTALAAPHTAANA